MDELKLAVALFSLGALISGMVMAGMYTILCLVRFVLDIEWEWRQRKLRSANEVDA